MVQMEYIYKILLLPQLLSPTLFLYLVTSVTGAFKIFDEVLYYIIQAQDH